MSDPYVQPSLSGYNASPPADDGTAVTANALKWSKHISKIGDPLKTYSQAIDANLVTAFGKIFGHNVATKSGNYTVVSADQGLFIEVTATATITLLPAATAGSNFPLAIVNTGSGVVTVDGNASETINGSPTITLNPGMGLIITCNATKWIGLVYDMDFSGLVAIQGNALAATDGLLVDDGGVPKRMEYSDAGLRVQVVSGTSDTLGTADMNTFIEYTNGSAIAVTLDTGVGVKGNVLIIQQAGAGQVTVSGTATFKSAIGEKTRDEGSVIVLLNKGSDVWAVYGDMAA